MVALLMEDDLFRSGATIFGLAGSVAEAMLLIDEAIADGGLSAAVLDINLNGATVLPVADRLAALGVPFIFATGYGEDCERGCHAARPVLAKPFGTYTLLSAVRDLDAGRTAYE